MTKTSCAACARARHASGMVRCALADAEACTALYCDAACRAAHHSHHSLAYASARGDKRKRDGTPIAPRVEEDAATVESDDEFAARMETLLERIRAAATVDELRTTVIAAATATDRDVYAWLRGRDLVDEHGRAPFVDALVGDIVRSLGIGDDAALVDGARAGFAFIVKHVLVGEWRLPDTLLAVSLIARSNVALRAPSALGWLAAIDDGVDRAGGLATRGWHGLMVEMHVVRAYNSSDRYRGERAAATNALDVVRRLATKEGERKLMELVRDTFRSIAYALDVQFAPDVASDEVRMPLLVYIQRFVDVALSAVVAAATARKETVAVAAATEFAARAMHRYNHRLVYVAVAESGLLLDEASVRAVFARASAAELNERDATSVQRRVDEAWLSSLERVYTDARRPHRSLVAGLVRGTTLIGLGVQLRLGLLLEARHRPVLLRIFGPLLVMAKEAGLPVVPFAVRLLRQHLLAQLHEHIAAWAPVAADIKGALVPPLLADMSDARELSVATLERTLVAIVQHLGGKLPTYFTPYFTSLVAHLRRNNISAADFVTLLARLSIGQSVIREQLAWFINNGLPPLANAPRDDPHRLHYRPISDDQVTAIYRIMFASRVKGAALAAPVLDIARATSRPFAATLLPAFVGSRLEAPAFSTLVRMTRGALGDAAAQEAVARAYWRHALATAPTGPRFARLANMVRERGNTALVRPFLLDRLRADILAPLYAEFQRYRTDTTSGEPDKDKRHNARVALIAAASAVMGVLRDIVAADDAHFDYVVDAVVALAAWLTDWKALRTSLETALTTALLDRALVVLGQRAATDVDAPAIALLRPLIVEAQARQAQERAADLVFARRAADAVLGR